MIAGATTNARTAIGTVTEAQMPRIFGKEYCAELSAAPIGLGSDCVVVMPPASAGTPAGTSPCGLQIAEGSYAPRVMPACTWRAMRAAQRDRTVVAWPGTRH